MSVFLGIDLGSTTSKAIIVSEKGSILGRGITNTRSDYNVAADIARMDAEFNARFSMLRNRVIQESGTAESWNDLFVALENRFHYLQFERRCDSLSAAMKEQLTHSRNGEELRTALDDILLRVRDLTRAKFFEGRVSSSSEFFRDLFSAAYMKELDGLDRAIFDTLTGVYDRSINPVENQVVEFDFKTLTEEAISLLPNTLANSGAKIAKHLPEVIAESLKPEDYVGTGYGRQLLPFEKQHIKSEILCHALGAHCYFPMTRTVLDIGGQDTKAIQVDEHGLVTSFQMNDRCAAGCGRYLGYIADEMSISVGELGPMAMAAERETNICSTCTVFAGAELREHLNLGEKKENVLAGLHLAIVQRAFALLARSGGARNEFTFTGGVARNKAVVKYVSNMTRTNYGDLTINIHPDSIFMGALGAAMFCLRRR
ncbi:benzoyl-CoA reductase subunit A [bacterium]|nr:benzoyl-CoA reductase subunit A [bacterium]